MIAPIINQNQIARNKLADKINEIIAELNPILEERGHLIKVYEEVSKNMYEKSMRMEKEFAEDETERLQKELIRTRKALDVAVDALNTIKGKHDPRCAVYHIDEKTAYDALEQITALEQYATIYNEDIVPMLTPKNEEATDPYAEQRKWIGKLCRFWDVATDKGTYGVLTGIKDDRFVCPNGMFMCNRIRYHHCEPVNPYDDIIYKGE